MQRLLWLGALAACGDNPAATPPDANYPHDGFPASFSITSPTLADGNQFPDAHTCRGSNTSPQLDWTGGPPAQSFAVVMVNVSYFDQAHWMIYDIPATATGLPASVERTYAPARVAGAHQTTSYEPGVYGYLGPCSQFQDTYRFSVYALDVAALPGVTDATSIDDAIAALEPHELGSAGLIGGFTP